MFGPVGPKIGPTGPKISIVIIIGPDSAEPGSLITVTMFLRATYLLTEAYLTMYRGNRANRPIGSIRPIGQ